MRYFASKEAKNNKNKYNKNESNILLIIYLLTCLVLLFKDKVPYLPHENKINDDIKMI